MSTPYVDLIPRFPLFEGFTEDGAAMLLETGVVKEHPAGEILFHEGDEPQSVVLVLTGRLEVFVDRQGRHLGLMQAGPGTILGELAVLCGMNRTASIKTLEPSALLEWQEREFRRLLIGNVFLSQRILGQSLRTLVEREKALIDELVRRGG